MLLLYSWLVHDAGLTIAYHDVDYDADDADDCSFSNRGKRIQLIVIHRSSDLPNSLLQLQLYQFVSCVSYNELNQLTSSSHRRLVEPNTILQMKRFQSNLSLAVSPLSL